MGQGKEGPKKLEKGNNKWSEFPKKARRKARIPETREYGVYVG